MLAQLLANHKLEARPDVADGTDLDVNEPEGKADFSDCVLGDVCWNFRSLLWPGNPNDTIWPDVLTEGRQLPL